MNGRASTRPLDPHQQRPDGAETPQVRVTLRPIATPLSLGFLALAAASFVMSGLELAWVNPATSWTTVGLV